MTPMLENRLAEEIAIGGHAAIARAQTSADIRACASVTGDANSTHRDAG